MIHDRFKQSLSVPVPLLACAVTLFYDRQSNIVEQLIRLCSV